MGTGDWIMSTAVAKRLHQANGVPVMIVNRFGKPQWDPIFENNPRITIDTRARHQKTLNAANNRPYIAMKTTERWVWRRTSSTGSLDPGEIYLTDAERAYAEPFRGRVLIEPNTKGTVGGNKAWIWERWQNVVDTPGFDFVQTGGPSSPVLRNVQFVSTPTFRHAAAILSVCSAFVGAEGGLHHAAAALGVPAVVLFGGFISPDITGYATHRNLFTGGKACGQRRACMHCREAMARISVEDVISNLREIHETSPRMVPARSREASDRMDEKPKESSNPERSDCIPGEEADSGAATLP